MTSTEHATVTTNDELTRSTLRSAALVAGISTLAMAGFGMFANITLMNLGDADQVVGTPLRLAIVAFLIVAVLDVVLAWAITRYFGQRHGGLATLAAWLRISYAAVLVTATAGLALALQAEPEGARAALVEFSTVWQLALTVFAAHLVVLGVLVIRDASTPTVLGVIILIAGAAYAFDGIARLLLNSDSVVFAVSTVIVAASSIFGEAGLGVWFLVRGGRALRARGGAAR